MASSGNLISYSNFSNTYSGSLLLDKTPSFGADGLCAVYVSSPSWYAQVKINKSASNPANIVIYAAYWNGSTWVDAWKDARVMDSFDKGEKTYNYYHNSTLGSTSGDVASAVLWEIYLQYITPRNRIRLGAYAGGIGCMPKDTYNSLYKGGPIYSCGRLGLSSIYGPSDRGRTRDEALSVFSQSANRGTLITASNEHKLVAYRYN